MKIAYYGYRDWSLNIFSKITEKRKYLMTSGDYEVLEKINPELVFFIGWSEIVPKEIIEKYVCICLHPSPLPKYRGGSPIQNQIMNGEIDSAVTFFIMDQGLDTGDIIHQSYLSLDGKLSSIFERIEKIGSDAINKIIEDHASGALSRRKQEESEATFYRRRKPSNSEITPEEIMNSDPFYLYNKIRSLNDPYPNAFISCKDGKKLFLIESRYEK